VGVLYPQTKYVYGYKNTDRPFFGSRHYTFSHLKRPFYWTKNKKKCKINSRNFTYDGLTFSSDKDVTSPLYGVKDIPSVE